MNKLAKAFLFILSPTGIVSAAPYNNTENNPKVRYQYGNYVQIAKNMNMYAGRSRDEYSRSLASEYKSLAMFRADFGNDLEHADHFAQKAISAFHGDFVKPDNPTTTWNLPEWSVIELSNNYDDIIRIINEDSSRKYPTLLADAVVKFDCWAEAMADWKGGELKQASVCRDRFLKAKNLLQEKIADDADCPKPKAVRAKNVPLADSVKPFDGTQMSLPRWPSLHIVSANPPQVWNGTSPHDAPPLPKSLTRQLDELKFAITTLSNSMVNLANLQKSENSRVSANSEDIKRLEKQIASLSEHILKLRSTADGGMIDFSGIATDKDMVALRELIENLAAAAQDDEVLARLEGLDKSVAAIQASIEELKNQTPPAEPEIVDEEEFIYEIYFDWAKDTIDEKFVPQLRDLVDKVLADKTEIIVEGHTDTTGTANINESLSYRRAQNVANLLIKMGIAKEDLIVQAKGMKDLKIPTGKNVKKAANRRVVIR